MRTAPVDIAGLAKFILSSDCRSIAILTGAGVSVASGIPDFRSPGGMYDTLRPELITATEQQRRLMRFDPTYVVAWDIFQENQFPYLEVRRPFILGTRDEQWKATISHRFFELLHMKTNKLTRLYTQNIDGLDFQCTNIPLEKIVPVHGTIRKAYCEGCGKEADYEEFCNQVKTKIKDIYHKDPSAPKESSPILCEYCHKPLVKPQTVLFGRALPPEFFDCLEEDMAGVDLLIVAGTSLVVSPASCIVQAVPDTAVRVIVNREPVGAELGIVYNRTETTRDFFAQGNCDDVFLDLIRALGWLNDIQEERLPPMSAACVSKVRRKR
jgi:NAD-dependent SIR2 family protein deacetylase